MSQQNQDWVAVYNKLGEELYNKGEYEQALAEFSRALAGDNSNEITYWNLGNTLYKLGRIKDGIAMLREAIRLNPGNSQYQEMLNRFGNLSDPLPIATRLAERMRDKSTLIEDGTPKIYQLPLKTDLENKGKLIRKVYVGQPQIPRVAEKVLMVVGAAGAGKTTLINAIVNYILGVNREDNFRFKLISDEGGRSKAYSQTQMVTAYTIYWTEGSSIPYTWTIIDSPGFGDTEGLEKDKFITSQIREFFSLKDGIDHLDGIGFVTQSPLERLTPTQEYIFDSILSLFGKDIAKNIFIMVTFADGAPPPVIEAIKEAKVPYSQFFEFNNSALFAKNDEKNRFKEMFWEMGRESLSNFFIEFQRAESISLKMTRNVLKERHQLETTIEGLQKRIDIGLDKLDEIRQEQQILLQHQAEIAANKDFTRRISVPKSRQISLSRGEYVTNCLRCNCTCHYPCGIPKDEDKNGCAAMNSNGYCSVCSCYWSSHVNQDFRYEKYTETETRTLDDLKRKYDTAVAGKNKVETMISNINKELQKVAEEVFSMLEIVRNCLQRLDEIALKPNPLTQEEYIELIIESEKSQKKPGWEKRVSYYQAAKKQARILSQVRNTNQKPDFKEWIESLRNWKK